VACQPNIPLDRAQEHLKNARWIYYNPNRKQRGCKTDKRDPESGEKLKGGRSGWQIRGEALRDYGFVFAMPENEAETEAET
jgi:hypothetical protein